MAYGFSCINDGGEVIISDELQTLHFVGKAARGSDDGGNFTTLVTGGPTVTTTSTDFPLFTGAIASNAQDGNGNALDGRVLIEYSITTSGRPLAFIKPNNSAYDRWYALVNQSNSGNDWTFLVLMSGATADLFPELFCFVDANEVAVSDGYGMVVYQADGVTKTFDSRAQPLAVIGARNIRPRQFPPNEGVPHFVEMSGNFSAFQEETLDHDFHSNDLQSLLGKCNIGSGILEGVTKDYCDDAVTNPNAFTLGTNNIDTVDRSVQTNTISEPEPPFTNFMFSAPSLAQAVYTRQIHGFTSMGGSVDFYSLAAWWVMYRAAYRITTGGDNAIQFEAGWGTYAAGYNYVERRITFEFFGDSVEGLEYGSQPYSSKTINNTRDLVFIIADATKYV